MILGSASILPAASVDWRTRFDAAIHAQPLVDELTIEPATLRDYKELAAYHYRSDRPGSIDQAWKLTYETNLVGIVVLSFPALSCAARRFALDGRYATLSPRESATLLNNEIRTISRVVIDPRWRGLGLAVRLVRHALENATTPYVEALAAMGRVHPFFERAGMTRYDPPVRPHDGQLVDALESVGADLSMFAGRTRVGTARSGRAAGLKLIHRELRRWGRCERVATDDFDELGALAARTILARPVYFLYYKGDTP